MRYTTDNVEGIKVVTEEDGVVAFQVSNSSNSNLYVTDIKDQSFKDTGIPIPPNTLWPPQGPLMFYGNLFIYTDSGAKVFFSALKTKTFSKKGVSH